MVGATARKIRKRSEVVASGIAREMEGRLKAPDKVFDGKDYERLFELLSEKG